MRNIFVTEITASGDGHYMMASIDGVEYKIRHDDPCTWENRDKAFQELLELIPEEYKQSVEVEYAYYCEGLRKAEEEAERLANMTDEERLEMFKQQMVESFMQEPENIEYEEVYEAIEE